MREALQLVIPRWTPRLQPTCHFQPVLLPADARHSTVIAAQGSGQVIVLSRGGEVGAKAEQPEACVACLKWPALAAITLARADVCSWPLTARSEAQWVCGNRPPATGTAAAPRSAGACGRVMLRRMQPIRRVFGLARNGWGSGSSAFSGCLQGRGSRSTKASSSQGEVPLKLPPLLPMGSPCKLALLISVAHGCMNDIRSLGREADHVRVATDPLVGRALVALISLHRSAAGQGG